MLLVVALAGAAALAAPPKSPPKKPAARAPAKPAGKPPTAAEMEALNRDDAAAEAAADKGDLEAALRYVDYFGHEQEDFASAMLEYGRSQRSLRRAVEKKFGEDEWAQAAAALGVPRHQRGRDKRSVRREGDVVYVKNFGAAHEAPYVNVDGVWKVSVRDVLLTALRARFGRDMKVEEADLHVLAGKMAKVIRTRAEGLSGLADSVESGGIQSAGALRAAIDGLQTPRPAR